MAANPPRLHHPVGVNQDDPMGEAPQAGSVHQPSANRTNHRSEQKQYDAPGGSTMRTGVRRASTALPQDGQDYMIVVKRCRDDDDVGMSAMDLGKYVFDKSEGTRTKRVHIVSPEGDEVHRSVVDEECRRRQYAGQYYVRIQIYAKSNHEMSSGAQLSAPMPNDEMSREETSNARWNGCGQSDAVTWKKTEEPKSVELRSR